MRNIIVVIGLIVFAGAAIVRATDFTAHDGNDVSFADCADKAVRSLHQLVHDAVSTDKVTAENAIRSLRAQGPDGLSALLDAHAETLEKWAANNIHFTATAPDDTWLRLRAALDGVSQQNDCYASKLFWFTDFDQAKAAAKASGKPIL